MVGEGKKSREILTDHDIRNRVVVAKRDPVRRNVAHHAARTAKTIGPASTFQRQRAQRFGVPKSLKSSASTSCAETGCDSWP